MIIQAILGIGLVSALFAAKCSYDRRLVKQGESQALEKVQEAANEEIMTRRIEQNSIFEKLDKNLKAVDNKDKSIEKSRRRLDILGGRK